MEWAYSEIVTIISQLAMLGPSIIFFKKYKQTKIDLNGLYCLVFSLLFINGLLEVLYSLVTHGYVELTDFIFYLFIMKTAVICLHLLILVYIAFRWILDDATLRPLYLFFGIGIVSIIYFLYAFYVFIYETPSDTLNSYIFTDYRYQFENGYYLLGILDISIGPFRLGMFGFVTLLVVALRIDLENQPEEVQTGFKYFRFLILFFIAYNMLGFLRSEEFISPDALSESGWDRYWDIQITFTFIGNLSVFYLLINYPNMLIATQAMSARVINTYEKLGLVGSSL